jgi:hypothetical protein
MNTADALGDAFFKFRTVLSINECLFPTPNGCVVQTRVFSLRAIIDKLKVWTTKLAESPTHAFPASFSVWLGVCLHLIIFYTFELVCEGLRWGRALLPLTFCRSLFNACPHLVFCHRWFVGSIILGCATTPKYLCVNL